MRSYSPPKEVNYVFTHQPNEVFRTTEVLFLITSEGLPQYLRVHHMCYTHTKYFNYLGITLTYLSMCGRVWRFQTHTVECHTAHILCT